MPLKSFSQIYSSFISWKLITLDDMRHPPLPFYIQQANKPTSHVVSEKPPLGWPHFYSMYACMYVCRYVLEHH